MTIKITYFVHGTTEDNEKALASGWYDVKLSKLGIEQSKKLKELIKDKKFDVVFCSDLKRAVDSAELTFKSGIPIKKDIRLRECNYGDLTQEPTKKIDSLMEKYIDNPFPNGESYKDVEKRIRDFLKDLQKRYDGKKVAIIAHKAPQLALDVIIKGKSWKQAIKEDWRRKKPKEWKPGWDYNFNNQ